MDGMHDLGGRQGFGKVRYTPNATAFHAAWEVRANSLYAFAVRSGIFNMDEYRHAIERMEPRHYLGAGYYERLWWSPDSRKIAYVDISQTMYWIDLQSGVATKIVSVSAT